MSHLRGNWLLLTLLAIYGAYVGIGMITPKPYVFKVVAILLLMAGGYMFLRYAGKTWDILWRQERGKYGAHHAILGTCELGLGLLYTGMYRLVWDHFGQPDAWSLTWYSSLGAFMIAKGAFRVATSPSDEILSPRFPGGFWKIVLVIFGMIVAFVAGTRFG